VEARSEQAWSEQPPAGPAPGRAWPVLVLGAGPAGCAVALALRRAGVDVLVLERGAPDDAPSGVRIESATPDVPRLLAELGVDAPTPRLPWRGTVSAWGGPWHWRSFADRGQGDGWLLDRAPFDAHLRRSLRSSGVPLCTGWTLAGLARPRGGWAVRVRPTRASSGADPSVTLRAAVLVDATGRRAALAAGWLGVRSRRCDRQVALQTRVPAETWTRTGAPSDRVWVEAVPEGWWCAVPSPEGSVSLSLMGDADLPPAVEARAGGFGACLVRSRWWREVLGTATPPPPLTHRRAAHAACLSRAVGPGWVAVGDALMCLDPLSSSGLSGALRDGRDVVAQLLLPWWNGVEPVEPARAWSARAEEGWQRFLWGARDQHRGMPETAGPWWRRRHQGWPAAQALGV